MGFTVSPLSISGIAPIAGSPGTVVTIAGNGFGQYQNDSSAGFNGTPRPAPQPTPKTNPYSPPKVDPRAVGAGAAAGTAIGNNTVDSSDPCRCGGGGCATLITLGTLNVNRATEVAKQLDMMNGRERLVDRVKIRELMNDSDLEVQGVIYAFIMEDSRRANPPLGFEEIFDFTVRYYTRCFKENVPKTGWASTRYTAGHDLVNWFAILFNDSSIPRQYLVRLKGWMSDLYKTGDEELRTRLVTAILEHLFEQKKIRKFFDDWKQDPTLKVAYGQALEWVTRGSSTPLGKPEWFRKNQM